MESAKIAATGQVKFSLRELDLKRGGNNVRWLNDREDRMLQKSLNLMEKAHKVTLSRLQHEVQGLQDTLRGQATVRNPQLSKKMHAPEKENSGAKRTTTSIHTFDLRRLRSEDLSPASKFGDEIPNSTVEEFEDVENILFEGEKSVLLF